MLHYVFNSFQQLSLLLDFCAHEEQIHLSTRRLVNQDIQQCRTKMYFYNMVISNFGTKII